MPDTETEDLLRDTLAFAREQLVENGGFVPFGTLVTNTGERSVLASEEDDVTEAIQGLRRAFAGEADAGLVRATAVCFDIVTTPPGQESETDAICIELESRDGVCKAVIVPYRQGSGGGPTYGDPIEAQKQPEVFTGS